VEPFHATAATSSTSVPTTAAADQAEAPLPGLLIARRALVALVSQAVAATTED
jgi:hypothetical protein